MLAIEAAAGRREAERAAREAIAVRIQAEIASNTVAREAAGARLEQVGTQQAELVQRDEHLTRELDAMQAELSPVEEELRSTEER